MWLLITLSTYLRDVPQMLADEFPLSFVNTEFILVILFITLGFYQHYQVLLGMWAHIHLYQSLHTFYTHLQKQTKAVSG